jgi:glycosyltransferase involved in cell wall biosynthesis
MTLRFLAGQAAFMSARGFEVHAISSPGPELEEFGRVERVAVHGVNMARRITPLADLRAVASLSTLLVRLRPAVVHAHTPKGGLLGMLAARLAGIPRRVYHVHGLPFTTREGPARALLRRTEHVACGLATDVLCVSRSVRDVLVRERLCAEDRARVLGGGSVNGVDAGRFRPATPAERAAARGRLGLPQDAFVVGFVGRIVREKGVAELAEAFRRLRGSVPTAHLVVVGPEEAQYPVPAAVVAALRADPHVRLRGLDWETPALYPAFDVVALPSHREGLPVVPLEAAASGLPVVATRVVGCVDAVIDGETGTLVPPRDPDALAAALARYAADPSLAARQGAAGRRRALAEFDPPRIWAELLALYRPGGTR